MAGHLLLYHIPRESYPPPRNFYYQLWSAVRTCKGKRLQRGAILFPTERAAKEVAQLCNSFQAETQVINVS